MIDNTKAHWVFSPSLRRLILLAFMGVLLVGFFRAFFKETLRSEVIYSVISPTDDIFIVCLTFFVLFFHTTRKGILLLIGINIFIGCISAYRYHGLSYVTILGAYNSHKALLLYWCFANIRFDKDDIEYFFRLLKLLFFPLLVFVLVDLLVPGFRTAMNYSQKSEIRFGMRSIGGIMPRYTMLSLMGGVYYLYFTVNSRKSVESLLQRIVSALFVVLTLRIKEIIAFFLLMASGTWQRIHGLALFVFIAMFFMFFGLYAFLLPDHFEQYFQGDEEKVARVALNNTCVQIAKDHFPLGVGFGCFASAVSKHIESPVYADYGIDNVWGIRFEGEKNFTTDCTWPMILGETGVLGLVCYLVILYAIFGKYIAVFMNNTRNKIAGIVAPLFLFCLIGSIAKATLVGPPHSLMLFGLAGMFHHLLELRLIHLHRRGKQKYQPPAPGMQYWE